MDIIEYRIAIASILLQNIEVTTEPEKSALVIRLANYRIKWVGEDAKSP